jgi:hypothetical protein
MMLILKAVHLQHQHLHPFSTATNYLLLELLLLRPLRLLLLPSYISTSPYLFYFHSPPPLSVAHALAFCFPFDIYLTICFNRLRASAEFITLAQHEKDAAAAEAHGDNNFDDDACSGDSEVEALDMLEADNERRRGELQSKTVECEADDADAVPCVLEMHQRTKGLFRR